MASINWPWKPLPVENTGDPPPPTMPSYTMTFAPTLVLGPLAGMPAEHPPEVMADPDFPDHHVLAFDDTRPEGVVIEIPTPRTDPTGFVVRIRLRARTAPAADSAVVFRISFRPVAMPTTWTGAVLPAVDIAAGNASWIETDLAVAPADLNMPKNVVGRLMLWRDPIQVQDTLVGDVLVAAAHFEVHA